MDEYAFALHGVPRAVDAEVAVVVNVVGRLGEGAAADLCCDAGHQLLHRERLRHIVVRPQLEAEQLVALLHAGRQHQDWDAARLLVLLQLAADREPVHVGKVQVEQHEVGGPREERVERDEATGEPLDLVTPVLLEVVGQREGEILVVLDDDDALTHGARHQPNLPVM